MARQYAVPGATAEFVNETGSRTEGLAAGAFGNETTVTTLSVAPGAGSIIFTGFAPTVVTDMVVAPGVGSIVFTGFAPTVVYGAVVSPDAGSIVFTGFAPTIDITVEPGAGSITFTGQAPTVSNLTAGGPMFSIIL
jgi:hypothetical protein